MKRKRTMFGWLVLFSLLNGGCDEATNEIVLPKVVPHSETIAGIEIPAGLPPFEQPEDNVATLEKIKLGEKLFFDKNLSVDRTVSCASCHDPEKGWSNGQQFAEGVGGVKGTRNVPSLYNVAYYRNLFWDGRSRTLESQVLKPMLNQQEMGMPNEKAVLDRLKEDEAYEELFQAAFEDGVSIRNMQRAIACFERTILTGTTPYDRYVQGESNALSEAAKRGLRVFLRRGQCANCHLVPLFHDHAFYNLGIGMDQDNPDLGRFHVVKIESSKGKFKTPTLRDIVKTAPYMHDGSVNTLEEVVELYDKGGIRNRYLSDEFRRPLRLTKQQKADLVKFMEEGLTSDEPVAADKIGASQ